MNTGTHPDCSVAIQRSRKLSNPLAVPPRTIFPESAAAGRSDASCSAAFGHLGRSSPISRCTVWPRPAVLEDGSETITPAPSEWSISMRVEVDCPSGKCSRTIAGSDSYSRRTRRSTSTASRSPIETMSTVCAGWLSAHQSARRARVQVTPSWRAFSTRTRAEERIVRMSPR